MKRRSSLGLKILMLLGMVPFLSGCTAIGFAIGQRADDLNRERRVTADNAGRIPYGREVHVACIDGDSLTGVYRGIRATKDTLYLPTSGSSADLSLPLVPSVGDTITITKYGSRLNQCQFAGLNRYWIHYQREGREHASRLKDITLVSNSRGENYDHQRWSKVIRSKDAHAPCYTLRRGQGELVLKQGSETARIPLQNIEQIAAPGKSTNYWATGLVMGLLVDGAIVAIIANATASGSTSLAGGFGP